MSCGVCCRLGSDVALLGLWCRLAAAASIGPLAWEPPCAMGTALKKKNRKCLEIASVNWAGREELSNGSETMMGRSKQVSGEGEFQAEAKANAKALRQTHERCGQRAGVPRAKRTGRKVQEMRSDRCRKQSM